MPGARVHISEIRAAGGLKPWLEQEKAKIGIGVRPAFPVCAKISRTDRHQKSSDSRPLAEEKDKLAATPKGPNQTEQRYRDTYLVPRILSGEIVECIFEGVTLILSQAERCRYTPDFWVRLADGGYEAHEVKGPQVWEDSRIKVKWAAQVMPSVRFVWGQWRGGEWKVREVRR